MRRNSKSETLLPSHAGGKRRRRSGEDPMLVAFVWIAIFALNSGNSFMARPSRASESPVGPPAGE